MSDVLMYPVKYEGDIYRPPSEARSLILQATIGCSHNRCTFCKMYKRKKYRVRDFRELETEIVLVSQMMPKTKRIFLADGNALSIPFEQLAEILRALQNAFPHLERVSLYGNPQDLLEKSVEQLEELKSLKLGIIYLGIESGSAAVLENINKGVTPQQVVEGASRAKEAGVPLSITIINGLAGAEGSAEHAKETAALLNKIDPEYVGLLSLMTEPGTTMHRRFKEGLLTPLSPWELLKEIRMMVEGLSLTNCVFRANHASNYLPLGGNLPADRDRIVSLIDAALSGEIPLRPDESRGL